MIPVDQTKFGVPFGNCFEACVASIIELPLEQCTIFPQGVDFKSETDIRTGKHWWPITTEWLLEKDVFPVFVMASELRGRSPRGYSIMSGKAERGFQHSVVALDGIMVHDPHSSRVGLLQVRDFIILFPVVVK
jgi:hypothetical protein